MRYILKNKHGMALILTLLIVSLVTVLSLQLNTSMRAEYYAAVNLKDSIKLESIAKSGFYFALIALKDDDTTYDCLLDDWESIKDASASAYFATLFDGDGFLEGKVADLERKIQINSLIDQNGQPDPAQKDLLSDFMQLYDPNLNQDQAEEIVDAIVDWVDSDDNTTGFGGAEDSYYQLLDNPYSCKNGPLESIEELLLVKGISQEFYDGIGGQPGLAHYLTVINGNGQINVNTADKLILKALSDDITDKVAEDLDQFRNDPDNENDLKNVSWVNRVVSGITFKVGIAIKSTYFEIMSTGKKDKMEKMIRSVVERDSNGNSKVLYWKIL